MLAALALAVGLAMDAMAVAAARGLRRAHPADVVVLPLLFGAFQAGMVALGWALGAWGGPYVERWDYWIAFALLVGIGGKMLFEALRGGPDGGGDDAPRARETPWLYLGLALATSIDAAAAGLTLPLLPAAPGVAIALVGVVTAALSAVGYLAGQAAGARFGKKLEIVGGLMLVGIAVKLLVEHL